MSIISPNSLNFRTAMLFLLSKLIKSRVNTLLFVINMMNVLEQLICKWLYWHHSSEDFKPLLNFEITSMIDESQNNKVVSTENSFKRMLVRKNGKSLIIKMLLIPCELVAGITNSRTESFLILWMRTHDLL